MSEKLMDFFSFIFCENIEENNLPKKLQINLDYNRNETGVTMAKSFFLLKISEFL